MRFDVGQEGLVLGSEIYMRDDIVQDIEKMQPPPLHRRPGRPLLTRPTASLLLLWMWLLRAEGVGEGDQVPAQGGHSGRGRDYVLQGPLLALL